MTHEGNQARPRDPEGAEDQAALQDDVVLEISDLRAGYGDVPVLRGVSFKLREGETIGIVGHNGMGKTTLLKTIMGLLPARGGKIMIDGLDVTQWPAHERARLGIGYVPQGRGILAGLTTQENLRLAWTPDSGETEEHAVDRVLQLLPRLGGLLDRSGGALSGGEQQMLALGRALVSSPWLLILDEPSEGIQPSIVEEIGAILSSLRAQHSLSMLIVEQNLELVLDVASRIVLMERGRISRELDAAAVRNGAIADLVGLGGSAMRGGNAPAARVTSPATHRRDAVVRVASATPLRPAGVQPERTRPNEFKDGALIPSRNSTSVQPAPRPLQAPGNAMSNVKRPTLEQMKEIVASLHMSMSDTEVSEYLDVLE